MTRVQRWWLRLATAKHRAASPLANAALERLAIAPPADATEAVLRRVDADMEALQEREEYFERDTLRLVHLADQLAGISSEVASRGRILVTHRMDEIDALREKVVHLGPEAEHLLPEIDAVRSEVAEALSAFQRERRDTP